jgi:hypothetical protein
MAKQIITEIEIVLIYNLTYSFGKNNLKNISPVPDIFWTIRKMFQMEVDQKVVV